jgi:hypothetical protein
MQASNERKKERKKESKAGWSSQLGLIVGGRTGHLSWQATFFCWINESVPDSGTTRQRASSTRAQAAAGPPPIPGVPHARTSKQGS